MATADTQEKGSAMKSRFVVRGNGFTDEEWEQIEGNYEPGTPVLTSAEDEWVRAALWEQGDGDEYERRLEHSMAEAPGVARVVSQANRERIFGMGWMPTRMEDA